MTMKTLIGLTVLYLASHKALCRAPSAYKYPNVRDVDCELVMYQGDNVAESENATTENGENETTVVTQETEGWNCYPGIYESAMFYGVPVLPQDISIAFENGARWVRIYIPDESDEALVVWEPIPPSARITVIPMGQEYERRSIPRKVGNKSVIIMRVIALDRSCPYSTAMLSDMVFGTHGAVADVASQYTACSRGLLNLQPSENEFTVEGVTNVTVNMNATGALKTDLIAEAREAFFQVFGNAEAFDHIMICAPPGSVLPNGDTWGASADINGKFSTYNGWSMHSLTGMVHEIGHNLGLLHSSSPNAEYGDSTCNMGITSTSKYKPLKCFNAPKVHQLGWFPECHTLVNNWTTPVPIYLRSASQYTPDSCNTSEAVTLAIQNTGGHDVYVFYNKAVGPSAGVDEEKNKVTITTAELNTKSILQTGLYIGQEHVRSLANGVVRIRYCALVTGRAFVVIGRNDTSDLCAL